VSGLRYHPEFVEAEVFGAVDAAAQESLRALIEAHVAESESGLGKTMLADWERQAAAFVRLTPKVQV
jgi:glutamate synthase (ferredoxin)